jgi:hypothetical protein
MTKGIAVIVIARYEAIQCTRIDCFTAFAMTEGVMDCFLAVAMMKGVVVIVIARYEAIRCTRIDCFTAFAMTKGVMDCFLAVAT